MLVAIEYEQDRHEIRKGVELFSTNWTLFACWKWQRAEDQALATGRHADVTLEVPNAKQIG